MGALMSRRALGLVLAILVWLVPSRALAQSETTEYYGLDTTGSVRVVFDAAGSVLTRVDYGPFGEQLAAASGAPNEKYAGLFRDDETGLDYAQARHYNPRTGRFTSLDPVYSGLFEPQRWNRYAYALNSPLTLVDPSGAVTQTVNCGLGSYWCPGAIQSGKDGDKYFDSYHYGYQGGEEGARAELGWGSSLDSDFVAAGISFRANSLPSDGQDRDVGKCPKVRCAQITNEFEAGLWKTEAAEPGQSPWNPFAVHERAVNTDGALFGDRLFKVQDRVHITVGRNGQWTFDSEVDRSLSYFGQMFSKELTQNKYYNCAARLSILKA